MPIGNGRVYWYATKNALEGELDSANRRKPELRKLFQGWHQPIEALIDATDSDLILRNDVYDRVPLKVAWGEGLVTLLGDAAHPTTPNLGHRGRYCVGGNIPRVSERRVRSAEVRGATARQDCLHHQSLVETGENVSVGEPHCLLA